MITLTDAVYSSMLEHEKNIVAKLSDIRDALKRTQDRVIELQDREACHIETINSYRASYEKDKAEIARLREDNHKIALAVYPHKNPHYPFSTSTEFIVEEIHGLHQNQAAREENDRMRKALEDVNSIADSYARNKNAMTLALRRAGLPDSWLSGWDAKFDRIRRALNPQPAQPEKP